MRGRVVGHRVTLSTRRAGSVESRPASAVPLPGIVGERCRAIRSSTEYHEAATLRVVRSLRSRTGLEPGGVFERPSAAVEPPRVSKRNASERIRRSARPKPTPAEYHNAAVVRGGAERHLVSRLRPRPRDDGPTVVHPRVRELGVRRRSATSEEHESIVDRVVHEDGCGPAAWSRDGILGEHARRTNGEQQRGDGRATYKRDGHDWSPVREATQRLTLTQAVPATSRRGTNADVAGTRPPALSRLPGALRSGRCARPAWPGASWRSPTRLTTRLQLRPA